MYEYGDPRWNDVDRGNPKISYKNLSRCQMCSLIPHGLNRVRTRVSVVRGRRLTTLAIARPSLIKCFMHSLAVLITEQLFCYSWVVKSYSMFGSRLALSYECLIKLHVVLILWLLYFFCNMIVTLHASMLHYVPPGSCVLIHLSHFKHRGPTEQRGVLYNGRRITESLGNVTERGEKIWKE
jgi:hypothetical protein